MFAPDVGYNPKERRIMSKSVLRGALGASLLGLLAAPAFAHVSLATKQAQIGSTYKAVLGIGHGCGEEATQVFRVEIPEGFYNVKPMPKAGWDIELITGAYAEPYDNHGTQVSEGVREIIWSGGELPDAFFDEFAFRGTFGKDVPAGDFFFPATQECANGENPWTDTSGSHDVDWPAPKLILIGAEPSHGHHGDQAHAAEAGSAHAGDLTLAGAFTRATRPGAPVAGGFMTIENTGGMNDRLVAAASDVAGIMQIHEMRMIDDVMKMRELPDGLEIPAGETVALEPGGYHIMFMELNQPLVEGETVDVTLTFENGGDVTLPLAVMGANAGSAEAAGGHAH